MCTCFELGDNKNACFVRSKGKKKYMLRVICVKMFGTIEHFSSNGAHKLRRKCNETLSNA